MNALGRLSFRKRRKNLFLNRPRKGMERRPPELSNPFLNLSPMKGERGIENSPISVPFRRAILGLGKGKTFWDGYYSSSREMKGKGEKGGTGFPH